MLNHIVFITQEAFSRPTPNHATSITPKQSPLSISRIPLKTELRTYEERPAPIRHQPEQKAFISENQPSSRMSGDTSSSASVRQTQSRMSADLSSSDSSSEVNSEASLPKKNETDSEESSTTLDDGIKDLR